MSSSMGWTMPSPCANCGKEHGGFMGSSAWGHGYKCCNDRCGMRLKKRIENGMYEPNHLSYFTLYAPSNEDRLESMRTRIKQLKHQLKSNGIKPSGDRWDLSGGDEA